MADQGQVLKSRYRIVRKIGEGGMSYVFLALDIEAQRDVAIKKLVQKRTPAWAVGPDAIQRFQREANILSTLRHNNITEFYDYLHERGDHYIIMEYVSGGALHHMIRDGRRFSSREVCEIGLSLVSALTSAHDLRIVHRDIKPSNILFAEDSTIRLTDFGVAQLKANSPIERGESTLFGVIPGTIVYMSPEALSLGNRTDERSDIWSLGVVFYEMLLGRPPFEGGNNDETVQLIQTAPLMPVSIDLPAVWPALEAIITRMLAKDPRDRYPSMRRVGAELDEALRSEGVITPDILVTRPESLRDAVQRVVERVERFGQENNITPASGGTLPAPAIVPSARERDPAAGPYSSTYNRSRALVIAAGHYQDANMPRMPKALTNARMVAQLLGNYFHFDVTTLYDHEVTLNAVNQALTDLQQAEIDDCLIVYWAGSARTRPDRYGYERSFLATYDSRWHDWTSFLELETLVDVRYLPAKHVLFVIDAPTLGPVSVSTGAGQKISLETAMRYEGFHFLSAGLKHMETSTNATLFTGMLVQGLRGKAADEAGIISADSLGAYVIDQIEQTTGGEQQPVYARLPGGEAGNLIFRIPPAAYLPSEVMLCVRSSHANVRHGIIQVLQDFAMQTQDRVQRAALDQLEHLARHDPVESIKDAASQALRVLHGDAETDPTLNNWRGPTSDSTI